MTLDPLKAFFSLTALAQDTFRVTVRFPRQIAVIGALSITTSAIAFQNGDFEIGSLDGWSSSGTVAVASEAMFIAVGGTGSFLSGQYAVSFGGANLFASGVLEQVLSTSPGTSYFLSFDYGAFDTSSSSGRTQALQVVATDEVLNTVLLSAVVSDSSGTNDLSVLLSPYLFTVHAIGSATRFTFIDVSPVTVSIDGVLDNLALTPVPEIPTYLSLLLGLALLCRRGGRRAA
jgi:hypothetical protein